MDTQIGNQIAQSLYDNSKAVVYQVRSNSGQKLAQYKNQEETRDFLRNRENENLEVWVMEGTPRDLVKIINRKDFLN